MSQGNRMFKVTDVDFAKNVEAGLHQDRYLFTMYFLKSKVSLNKKTIFDFGCGDGTLMRVLEKEGATVSGCDVSKDLINLAGKTAILGGVEVIENLKTESLDVLMAISVFPFMTQEEQNRFWPEVRRVLKPGGIFYFACANSLAVKARHNYTADPYKFPAILKSHNLEEFEQDFYNYARSPISRVLFKTKEKITSLNKLVSIPKFIRRRRCSIYFSLSKRI